MISKEGEVMKSYRVLIAVLVINLLSAAQVFSMQSSKTLEGDLVDNLMFYHDAVKALAALEKIGTLNVAQFEAVSLGETPFRVLIFSSKLPPQDIIKIGEKLLQKGAPKEELNELLPLVVNNGSLELVKWLVSKGAHNLQSIPKAKYQLEMAEEDQEIEKISLFKEIIAALESHK